MVLAAIVVGPGAALLGAWLLLTGRVDSGGAIGRVLAFGLVVAGWMLIVVALGDQNVGPRLPRLS